MSCIDRGRQSSRQCKVALFSLKPRVGLIISISTEAVKLWNDNVQINTHTFIFLKNKIWKCEAYLPGCRTVAPSKYKILEFFARMQKFNTIEYIICLSHWYFSMYSQRIHWSNRSGSKLIHKEKQLESLQVIGIFVQFRKKTSSIQENQMYMEAFQAITVLYSKTVSDPATKTSKRSARAR